MRAPTAICLWYPAHNETDNVPDIDTKYIQKIRFSTGDVVDGLAIDYTDGTSTEWHGGQGGHASEFELSNGEDITQIQVCFDNQFIRGLQFTTSNGTSLLLHFSMISGLTH